MDDETLHTASKFAKYAIAAYGQFGLDYKDETGYASHLSLQPAFALPAVLFDFSTSDAPDRLGTLGWLCKLLSVIC